MRSRSALVPVTLLLTVAACARPATSPGPVSSAEFRDRAVEVAAAWLASPASRAWRTGFVPLDGLTVLPPGASFPDGTKPAFVGGWYRSAVDLPDATGTGTIRFADGHALRVPLLAAGGAYRQLHQGDPPPCPAGPGAAPDQASRSPSAPGAASPAAPGGVAPTRAPGPCTALVVTAARLDTVRLLTSRGWATVPAWRFTVDGLDFPIQRVAVDPSAVAPLPAPPPDRTGLPEGLDSAAGPVTVDGRTLRYFIGVGTCDTDLRPLVYEDARVVVLGGSARRPPGDCNAAGVLKPVSVRLAAPLGTRPVLDVAWGAPLTPYR